jgi:L-fuculose-phosphate aldolase
MDKHLIDELKHISLSMFNKNFFGVYHGSISARIGQHSFIINKRETILDELNEDALVKLDCHKRDYRWQMASGDVHIHEQIYETLPGAKYVSYTMPPYATAYSLKHGKVSPGDYYGTKLVGDVTIYDPKHFEDWMERAPFEIARFFKEHETHLLLIRGFGLIAYDRDITEMAKKIAVLENSCRLLTISAIL